MFLFLVKIAPPSPVVIFFTGWKLKQAASAYCDA